MLACSRPSDERQPFRGAACRVTHECRSTDGARDPIRIDGDADQPQLTDCTISWESSRRFKREPRYSVVTAWSGRMNRAELAPAVARARSSSWSLWVPEILTSCFRKF